MRPLNFLIYFDLVVNLFLSDWWVRAYCAQIAVKHAKNARKQAIGQGFQKVTQMSDCVRLVSAFLDALVTHASHAPRTAPVAPIGAEKGHFAAKFARSNAPLARLRLLISEPPSAILSSRATAPVLLGLLL